MRRLAISTCVGDCQVSINDTVANLKEYVRAEKIAFITDRNVRNLYGEVFKDNETIMIDPGEQSKTLRTAETVYKELLALELDRFSSIIGIGGGMVCDVTGFCASTYMRGVHFGFVPTTLLAQVDASIGGKNGVNLNGFKNIIGVFNQPEFVLIDFHFLKTLPQKEFQCGIAEIIKHALIKNIVLFEDLEKHGKGLLSLRRDVLERTVTESIRIKSEVVTADAREKAERRLLNFGHTLGHAIEASTGLKHGEAVSLGMTFALQISEVKRLITSEERQRIQRLLESFGLPTHLSLDKKIIIETMKKDKKRQSKDVHFVLLSGIGKAEVIKMSFQELEEYIHDLC